MRNELRRRGFRHSLLARFLGAAIVIVVASVSGTAWILSTAVTRRDAITSAHAARTDQQTARAVQVWAGTHSSWRSVRPELSALSERTQRRIVLLDADGKPIADTDARLPIPDTAGLPIDPSSSTYVGTINPISTTVSGAFTLTDAHRTQSHEVAEALARCAGLPSSTVRTWPNGRAVVSDGTPSRCDTGDEGAPFPEERRALRSLTVATNQCLRMRSLPEVGAVALDTVSLGAREGISLQFEGLDGAVPSQTAERTRACLTRAWSELNTPLLPERAFLVSTPLDGADRPIDALTTESLARIAGVFIALITLSTGLVLLLSGRTVLRLCQLTSTAVALRDGDAGARATVRGSDEVAELGVMLNRLIDSQQQAEARRRQMSADIAHDLRTPLTNVNGWIEAYRDGVSNDSDEILDVVEREARHLSRLVDDLAVVTLADGRELPLKARRFDLAQLLRDIVTAQRTTTQTVVRYRGPADADWRGDESLLRRAVDNLVTNALQHGHASTVTLALTVRSDEYLVEVRDDGTGIEAHEIGSVFDRLWRADPSRSRPGSGLGTTITRQIVELHGGSVSVHSSDELGTSFQITLSRRSPLPTPPHLTDRL